MILDLAGLIDEVTATTDSWGVRHLRASNSHDVFFAQGYFAATDRLFQIDWWRRRGLGQVAEVLGPGYLERDRAARLLLFRGDMAAEWGAYGSGAREAVTAFVDGINARIAALDADPALLPPEFSLLDYRPGTWAPEDVVRIRTHGVFQNLEQEVARAVTLHRFGSAVEDLRKVREPMSAVTVPDGLDLACISPEVLATFRLAMGPVTPPVPGGHGVPDGSNNWAIMPSRTATGRPILASDPHRALTIPALRHLVHLTCPEFDVIGAGEPVLPGVSLGHNGKVAFGLTIFPVDQEDLYVYELNPDNLAQYRYGDGWADMTTVVESIPLADGTHHVAELQFTVHGPVVHIDPQRHRGFAVRAAWLEPGMAPYLNSLRYLTASSIDEFRRAVDHWGSPGANQLAADADGHISLTPRALVPIRPNWDGLLPVPGDGRYEWAGFRPADEFPTYVDPETGWLASANEMNLPIGEGQPSPPVSFEWFPEYRAERIREVLEADGNHTIDASASLQNDVLSVVARRVIDTVAQVVTDDDDASWALALLRGWDCRMTHDSVAASVFETWLFEELRPRLYGDAIAGTVPAAQTSAALRAALPIEAVYRDPRIDLRLLDALHRASPVALASLATETLGAAFRRLSVTLGADRTTWTWGRLVTTGFAHPFSALMSDLPAWSTRRGDAKSGSAQTVGVAVHDPVSGFDLGGASFRMIVDVGSWDESIAVSTPGQSGDPRSAHFDDLYATWLRDEYFPLLYSAEAVAKHAEEVVRLRPRDEAR